MRRAGFNPRPAALLPAAMAAAAMWSSAIAVAQDAALGRSAKAVPPAPGLADGGRLTFARPFDLGERSRWRGRAEQPDRADRADRADQPATPTGADPQPHPEGEPPPKLEIPPISIRKPFGVTGGTWWSIGGIAGYDFSDATDVAISGAASYFLATDLEVSGELNTWYYHQRGDDAIGINPGLSLRWHFVHTGPWTTYLDAGIGPYLATDNVPDQATSFGFMPHVGAGFTREIDAETSTRLQVGMRWHHISNARINGDARNPSRDGLALYAMLVFPF